MRARADVANNGGDGRAVRAGVIAQNAAELGLKALKFSKVGVDPVLHCGLDASRETNRVVRQFAPERPHNDAVVQIFARFQKMHWEEKNSFHFFSVELLDMHNILL